MLMMYIASKPIIIAGINFEQINTQNLEYVL